MADEKTFTLDYTGAEVNYAIEQVDEIINNKLPGYNKKIENVENSISQLALLEDDVLLKNNKIEYTPTDDYNPATKKYVDKGITDVEANLKSEIGRLKPIEVDLPIIIDLTGVIGGVANKEELLACDNLDDLVLDDQEYHITFGAFQRYFAKLYTKWIYFNTGSYQSDEIDIQQDLYIDGEIYRRVGRDLGTIPPNPYFLNSTWKLISPNTSDVEEMVAYKADILKSETDIAKIHNINDSANSTIHTFNIYGESTSTLKLGTNFNENLLHPPYGSKSGEYNGITFTVNDDGTITANGTATDEVQFNLYNPSLGHLLVTEGGDYTFSGCPQGGSEETYYVMVYPDATSSDTLSDIGNGVTFSYDPSTKPEGMPGDNLAFTIIIKEGISANNLVFKPMLKLGITVGEIVNIENPTISFKANETDDNPQKVTLNGITLRGLKNADGIWVARDEIVVKDGRVKMVQKVSEDITQLETPIETDITDIHSEAPKLLALHTNYPTTIITCDADCKVGYNADTTNTYNYLKVNIENSISQLDNAITELTNQVGDFEVALDTAIALCDTYINGGDN